MIDQLVNALVSSNNEAADDALLEALTLGNPAEKAVVIAALIRRNTVRGVAGLLLQFASLPEPLQLTVLQHANQMQLAVRDSARSKNGALKIAALKFIALSRQGRLAYVIGESLHDDDEQVSKTACEALTALARWVWSETRKLHREGPEAASRESAAVGAYLDSVVPTIRPIDEQVHQSPYEALITNRDDIEAAVARALDAHRGKHGQDLLRAALLLCDTPTSKTLGILHTGRHGGQAPMIRRLQQAPAAENVQAFLLAGSHMQVRSHFGQVFTHIAEAPVLDAILRQTHWLKDHQLQVCMHLVSRGVWWDDKELSRDLERRVPADAAKIGEWIAVSQIHDVMQDEKLEKLRAHASTDLGARLRLLRIALRRRKGASVQLIKGFLADPDERIVRLAAREIVRRRPPDFENMLLPMMTTAPLSVRKVISRAIGHAGFENFWQRFDRMDKPTRRQAGKAMLKLLPDAIARLTRRLEQGPADTRIKALAIATELDLCDQLKDSIVPLTQHPNARVRSKAIAMIGVVPSIKPDVILNSALHDEDARVRANAIEVLEETRNNELIPMLTERARSSHNRERANAIKALHKMKVGTAKGALMSMLHDTRGEHRVSALWAMRQIGLWELIMEVANMARQDPNMRVRRYALGVIRTLADAVEAHKSRGVLAKAG